jgi:hypothetical protein
MTTRCTTLVRPPRPKIRRAYPRKSSMMTSTEILQLIVAADGYIQVFRGPTQEHITVYRRDGTALLAGLLPRDILDDFVKQSYLKQDGGENENYITVYKLTTDGKKKAGAIDGKKAEA